MIQLSCILVIMQYLSTWLTTYLTSQKVENGAMRNNIVTDAWELQNTFLQ